MDTHFDSSDLIYISFGSLFILLSVFCYSFSKIKSALIFLFVGALIFRFWMCVIDSFIHIWDEQFHALVARNMISDPFNPMLYKNPALPFDFKNWTANHIWLHKQPLFLWQMALSMKIFGISPFAIRLPTTLLSLLVVPVVYRMGKLIFSSNVGYMAALFIGISNVQINIVSGYLNSDHNDAVFSYYIIFSIWAWVEYTVSGKKSWLLLIGLFSGMAVLVKWVFGLLVYVGWVVSLLAVKNGRWKYSKWIELAKSLAITILVALPWQLYAWNKWPNEYVVEVNHNLRHFSENLDHPGPWWFHFSILEDTYGLIFIAFLIAGIIWFLISENAQRIKWAVLMNVVFVYVFFSFAKTRMPFFCFIVSPLLILIAARGTEKAIDWIKRFSVNYHNIAVCFILIFVSFNFLNLDRLEFFHKDRDKKDYSRQARLVNQGAFAETKKLLKSCDYVVFNCPAWNAVEFMFYNGMTAYEFLPSESQFVGLKSQNVKMAVFDDIAIPDFLSRDSAVVKIPYQLVRNGF